MLFRAVAGLVRINGGQILVGGELLDPELTAGSDLGFEVLGGASVRWYDLLRVGVEAGAQLGQARFVVADRVQLVAFVGVEL